MKYALIEAERGELPVKRAYGTLQVSVSGDYAWQQRRQPTDEQSDEADLAAQIQAVFAESRGTYGSPRVSAALRQAGVVCNRKRVARLMPNHHLVAKHRRQRRVKTTDSRLPFPVAPNRLQRDFSAERPNEKWVADFTYIDTADGWLSLALVLDVFSHKIVGWAMENHLETSLVEQALQMALTRRQPNLNALLDHSDRGSQYASLTDQQRLAAHQVTVSMSKTADPYDNALMESCIGTLKTECADHRFPSRQVARTELFAYLEGWYNRRRLHSALGYLSPDQFEQRFIQDNFLFHSMG
jgi:transposase InsO family protein